MTDRNKAKTLEKMLKDRPEHYVEEDQEKDNSHVIRIAFTAQGEYPDGTKWERDATPEEEAELMSWAE